MIRMISALLILVLGSGAVLAMGDGGKIAWTECKNDKDFAKVLADASFAGRATVIYFTASS